VSKYKKALIAAAVLLVFIGVAVFLYETEWPPRVEDRELARIGKPVADAQQIGHPYESSGSVFCIDTCEVRAQAYSGHGNVSDLGDQFAQRLHVKGYGHITQTLCSEYNNYVILNCTVTGVRDKFLTGVTIEVHGAGQVDGLSSDTLAAPVSKSILRAIYTKKNDRLIVTVGYK
jgi:hypothetical protein